jgi:hypothetical protein
MIATGNHFDFNSLRDAPRSLVRNDRLSKQQFILQNRSACLGGAVVW